METITAKDFEKQETQEAPRIIKFVNFSDEPFTWTLNKIPYTFLPGEENAKYMEYPIALHFAKHLVNRELLKRGRENDTSPKLPRDNPYFMELFNRVIQPVEDGLGEADQTKLEQEAVDRNTKQRLARQGNAKKTVSKEEDKIPATKKKEDIKLATGQHTTKGSKTTKTASKDDDDFELLEGPGDED